MARSEQASPKSVFPGFEAVMTDAEQMIDVLAQRRRALGISQTTVAARMGTSQSAVARLEAGRSDARLSTLERYAAALDAALSYGVSSASVEGERNGGGPVVTTQDGGET